MSFSPLIQQLIQALRCLPGVGPKSAQRMALHVLQRNRDGGSLLAQTLIEAMDKVGHCWQCRTLCETELCQICSHPLRDQSLLCVVESPADIFAIEQTGDYRGLYFVLHGHLSPIAGLGPEEIGAPLFKQRLEQPGLQEIILATNPTVEGETTAYYLAELVKDHLSGRVTVSGAGTLDLKVTRIAHGVPLGGELEYLGGDTVAKAMLARAPL